MSGQALLKLWYNGLGEVDAVDIFLKKLGEMTRNLLPKKSNIIINKLAHATDGTDLTVQYPRLSDVSL